MEAILNPHDNWFKALQESSPDEQLLDHQHVLETILRLVPKDFAHPKDEDGAANLEAAGHEPVNRFHKHQTKLSKKQAAKLESKKAKRTKLEQAAKASEDSTPASSSAAASAANGSANSVDELRERIKKRIEDLRTKRQLIGTDNARRKERKEKRKLKESLKAPEKRMRVESKPAAASPAPATPERKIDDTVLPAISYGKIEYSTAGSATKLPKPGKNKKTQLKELLNKAEHNKKRLAELEEQGNIDAVRDAGLDVALRRAAGEKVKDDPKALKKSLKRIEKKKERSRKQWKAREKALQDEKKELIQKKLDKRNHIVEKRMANKAAKKGIVRPAGGGAASGGSGSGGNRAGFEGSVKGFLNK